MKRLHLIRHAKSSWKNDALVDHERPLKGRGRRDAALMAPAIVKVGWLESELHCSTASRAAETLALLQAAVPGDRRQGHYHDALYTFSGDELADWLRRREEPNITLVGHNPALHELHEWLSVDCLVNFPTCAYSQLTIDIRKWEYLEAGCARVEAHLTPRMLKG